MNWLSTKVVTWSTLSNFGNSKALRSSYFWIVFVPIAAKIIEKLPAEYEVSSNMTLVLSLPFSWKLFYFSACCFGVASLLYSIFCPKLVRAFKDRSEFIARGLTNQELFIYLSSWMRNGGQAYDISFNKVKNELILRDLVGSYAISGTEISDKEIWRQVRKIEVREGLNDEVFWFVRGLMYGDKPFWRFVISILYLAGISMIVWILIVNFHYVVVA